MSEFSHAISILAPFFATWVLVWLFGRKTFSRLDNTYDGRFARINGLDGLRAFLALAVVFHHLERRWRYFKRVGEGPISVPHFFDYLGGFGVSMFFMITAFLFWGRLLDHRGKIDWSALYINRFFRIVPLYWTLVAIYFLMVIAFTGGEIGVSVGMALGQAVKWLALGAYPLPEHFLGVEWGTAITGPTWTLFYEWAFYASLPFLAILSLRHKCAFLLIACLAWLLTPYCNLGEADRYSICFFLVGMLSAHAVRIMPSIRGDGPMRSSMAIGFLIAAYFLGGWADSVSGVLCLGGFFLLVASGASLFGLLTLPGSIRLGHMSYSIYLLHCVVLTIIFTSPFTNPAVRWIGSFGALFIITLTFIVGVAYFTYTRIEVRGIAAGHGLAKRLCRRSAPGSVGRRSIDGVRR